MKEILAVTGTGMNNKYLKMKLESKTRGSFVHQNISFPYQSRSHHFILNKLNFKIVPGATMVLGGVSGCEEIVIIGLLHQSLFLRISIDTL